MTPRELTPVTIIRTSISRPDPSFEALVRSVEARDMRYWDAAVEALHALQDFHTEYSQPLDPRNRETAAMRRGTLLSLHNAIHFVQQDTQKSQSLFSMVSEWVEREDIVNSFREDLQSIRESYWPEKVAESRAA